MIELGKKLVGELGYDKSVDTLGRWMAHYLAELIDDAERATADERVAKLQRCSDLILSLWKHRHELPNGKRPFEEIEPILRAVQSLDPENKTPRYFRATRTSAKESEHTPEIRKWLELADGFDYSARLLIRYCLVQAASTTLDKSQEWIALAQAAELDGGVDMPVLRLIIDEKIVLEDSNSPARKVLEERLERLNAFTEMATGLAASLRKEIQKLRPPAKRKSRPKPKKRT